MLANFLSSPQLGGIGRGLLAASGWSRTPVTLSAALGQGFAAGEEARRQAEQERLASEQLALREELGRGELDLQRQKFGAEQQEAQQRLALARQSMSAQQQAAAQNAQFEAQEAQRRAQLAQVLQDPNIPDAQKRGLLSGFLAQQGKIEKAAEVGGLLGGKQTSLIQNLTAAGLEPGTPEFRDAVLGSLSRGSELSVDPATGAVTFTQGGVQKSTPLAKELAKADAEFVKTSRENAQLANSVLNVLGEQQKKIAETPGALTGPVVGKVSPYLPFGLGTKPQELENIHAQVTLQARKLFEMPASNFSNADLMFLQQAAGGGILRDKKALEESNRRLQNIARNIINNRSAVEKTLKEKGTLLGEPLTNTPRFSREELLRERARRQGAAQ